MGKQYEKDLASFNHLTAQLREKDKRIKELTAEIESLRAKLRSPLTGALK